MNGLLTKRAMVLWFIALVGLIAGSLLLRMSDGARVQAKIAAYEANATAREAARIKATETGGVPLALHFTPRRLVSSINGEKVNFERASANEVFATMLDYERRGLGQIGQFAFALPEPGRVSAKQRPLC